MVAAVNEFTGRKMKTGPATKEYMDNYDLIFGKKKVAKILNLDMDGVLADFDRHFIDLHGQHPKGLATDQFWECVTKDPRWFSKLPVMHDSDILVAGACSWAKENGYEVHVLTALPSMVTMEHSENDKRDWLNKHFEMSVNWKFKVGPFAMDKQKHCNPGDILIDDVDKNIDQWNAAGGIGILHTSATDSLEQLYKLKV